MYSSNLPFATLEGEHLRIDYLTALGPRIIGLYVKGVEGNLFAVTPDQHWTTPHGEYYLHGGHRLWTAPEDPFYTVPEDHVSIRREPNKVTLRIWPCSKLADERLELHDDQILVHGVAADQAFKIGNYNPYGWIAYAMGDALFIKRFSVDVINRYPDMGCNAEAYIKNSCVELETLGGLKTLHPGTSMTYGEYWEAIVGEYPTIETARTIIKKFSKSQML